MPLCIVFIDIANLSTRETIRYYGRITQSLEIENGVKQGYILPPNLFEIILLVFFWHVFESPTTKVGLHTRTDCFLFILACIKQRVQNFEVQNLLFAADAALGAHSAKDLQTILSQLLSAC